MGSSIHDNHHNHNHQANILLQSTSSSSSSCHQSTIQSHCQNQLSGKIFSQSIGILQQQTDNQKKEKDILLGKVYEFTFSNLKGLLLFIFHFSYLKGKL